MYDTDERTGAEQFDHVPSSVSFKNGTGRPWPTYLAGRTRLGAARLGSPLCMTEAQGRESTIADGHALVVSIQRDELQGLSHIHILSRLAGREARSPRCQGLTLAWIQGKSKGGFFS